MGDFDRFADAYASGPVRVVVATAPAEPASASESAAPGRETCERPACPYCGGGTHRHSRMSCGESRWRCKLCLRSFGMHVRPRRQKRYGDGCVFLRGRIWWAQFKRDGSVVRTSLRVYGNRAAALEALRRLREAA